jgi:broad specificity phosphatase PhoE
MKVLYSIIVLASLLLMGLTTEAQVTKIFIVRHADRDGGLDALKVPLGTKRAQELKRILLNTGIDSIYSTNTNRTRGTAEPLANALDITTAHYFNSRQVIDTILKKHRGKEILVVGHSNTVDSLIKRCGCPGIGLIPDTQFDNLYLVIVERPTQPLLVRKRCHLLKMKYGAVTH